VKGAFENTSKAKKKTLESYEDKFLQGVLGDRLADENRPLERLPVALGGEKRVRAPLSRLPLRSNDG